MESQCFKKYFADVVSDIQSTIKYFKNNFHDFVPLDINSFYLNSTYEIKNFKNLCLLTLICWKYFCSVTA